MKKHWYVLIAAFVLGFGIIAFFYAKPPVVLDTPVRIPTRAEVVPAGSASSELLKTADEGQAPAMIRPNPLVKKTTEALFAISCPTESEMCKLQAIFDFVRTNFEYTERSLETPYIRPPGEMLIYGRGDEMELAMLMASMQRSAGFRNEIVRSTTSAWVRVFIGNETILIDPSCTGCRTMGARVTFRGDEIVYN